MFNFFGKKTNNEKEENNKVLVSPVNGKCIPLDDVKDDVFSQRILGDGVAFEIEDDLVCAPVSGTLTVVAETKHAFGITTDDEFVALVHVGLETVALGGQGLEALCKQGDPIKAGDPMLRIDREFMKERDIDLTIPVIFANGDEYQIDVNAIGENVKRGETVIASYKKI